jgi:CubicO group peptidase (beta-lactamase class C family)
MYCRRKFIRATGLSAIGLGLLPKLRESGILADFAGPIVLPRATPESQGIASTAIRSFIKAANESGLEWHSFMLLRHGHVVAEAWWKPFESQSKHTLYSLSKSFTSTAIGLLVKEKKISVNDLVTSFFKDELPANVSENLAKMKVKHLLTMNTGHGEDTLPKMRGGSDNWIKTFLAQPVTFEPGSHFLYNTGATYMLGAIVFKVTGNKLEDYLKPRLFKPLEISGFDWETSPDGLNTAGYGLRIRTEDIARFGQLYLQKGTWNGKEILPGMWVDEATSAQTTSQEGNGDWSQGYGYQFWRCKPGFYRGDGAYGQYCIVMPQYDAVMAVTSESWDMQKSMTTIWDNLLPAMQSSALPENTAELSGLNNDIGKLSLPVVKGLPSTPVAARYNGRKFKVEANDFGIDEIQFRFLPEGCKWVLKKGKSETTIQCGWSKWFVNSDSENYLFPVAWRINVPSKIAGTATWVKENTLQMNLKFVEAIHGDKITCVFDGNTVKIALLNSIAENTKNNPETRKGLTGNM